MYYSGGMRSPTAQPAIPRSTEWLCLALYTASRAMTARYRPALAELGLTYPQYLVMVALWENGSSSVGQLGRHLDLESSTLSPLTKRLETMGLLTRNRDTRDERTVNVGLTPCGEALQARAAAVPAEICTATGMTLSEQSTLVAQLRQLTATLEMSTDSIAHD